MLHCGVATARDDQFCWRTKAVARAHQTLIRGKPVNTPIARWSVNRPDTGVEPIALFVTSQKEYRGATEAALPKVGSGEGKQLAREAQRRH